jgi:bifunctional UDP-N-acetylglucosamine pyrophosphorylase / glucosamine-1-phosphate N-acetyltransferase
MNDRWTAIILAAGLGKRMRSRKPKTLHTIAGRPMLLHVLAAVRESFAATGPDARYVAVVGHGAEQVKAILDAGVRSVDQTEQLGTGHAVAQAQTLAKDSANVLVLNADVPLVTPETVSGLMAHHLKHNADLTFLTAVIDDPRGQGRVQRNTAGLVTGIVEEADADAATLANGEVNVGVYCFRGDWLWPRLSRIERSAAGEYYLTDLVGMAADEGSELVAMPVADTIEALGINDRTQLAKAEAVVRDRILRRHMLAGVTIVDPATTYVDADVTRGMDTTLYPGTCLGGETVIGEECIIGPGSQVVDSTLGDRCRVISSVVEQSTLEKGVDVGPFAHVRAGAHICDGVHIGNYAEVKNARLGRGTRMGHFSYVGDATVGEDVNIGAGTITCNFDGIRKHRTVIGDGAFIGSDTMLVAPVEIGAGARTGAGSVVNHDVPPNALAVGVPARIRRDKGGSHE